MRAARLSRRAALRGLGLAGISVGLPPLEAMRGARRAAAAPAARRLIVLHWPQGVPAGSSGNLGVWFPRGEGAAWTTSECLKPLEPHKADLNVVSGLSYRPIKESSGSHGHAVAIFTGHRVQGPEPEKSRGPSVQHVAARAIGTGTRFSLVGTSLYSQGEGWWSWSAAGVKDPLEISPTTLFGRLFSGATADPAAAMAAARRKRSILDHVRADAADLQRALGGEDRKRLDDHLTAVRELEKAVASVAPSAGTCLVPPAPPPDSHRLPVRQGNLTNDYSKMVEYTQLMIRLQVMAQRCDLTRVSFISLGGSQNYSLFPHLGIATDYHNICHSGFNEVASVGPRLDDRRLAFDHYKKIATHYAEQVAYLIGQLKRDDGLGALLDQAAVVCCSEFGDGGLHADSWVPFIVAGKAGQTGAAAMATGQNLVRTGRCTNDVWQSALTAIGALGPGQKFGDPTLDTKPLPGLWA